LLTTYLEGFKMIAELKKMGWEVDVIHERNHDFNWGSGKDCIIPRGGRTIVTLINKQDKSKSAAGLAICSMADNYERSKGRNIALLRAIKQIPELNEIAARIYIDSISNGKLIL
jgi:hypothetical protein